MFTHQRPGPFVENHATMYPQSSRGHQEGQVIQIMRFPTISVSLLLDFFNIDRGKIFKTAIIKAVFTSYGFTTDRVTGCWAGGRNHSHKVVLVGSRGAGTVLCACVCDTMWVHVTGASDDKRWQIGVKASRCSLTMPTTENQRHGAAEKTAVTNTYMDTQKWRTHSPRLHKGEWIPLTQRGGGSRQSGSKETLSCW